MSEGTKQSQAERERAGALAKGFPTNEVSKRSYKMKTTLR